MPVEECRRALRDAFEQQHDPDINAALAAAPSQAEYARLWCDVCDVAHHAGGDDQEAALVARVFALPLIIVTGSRKPLQIDGVVPDIGAVTDLFVQKGVLGKTQNFGIGNALCALETLESVTPVEVHAWTRASGAARRELVPAPLMMDAAGEQVYLRFLVGAGIAPVAEPAFVETASNIGAWGMALTRLLAKQLAQDGAEVLPMARPPSDFLRAAHAGRSAQLETACNLFASNAVRRFRASSGDPVAILSTHDNAELRLTLSQPFDDAMIDGFRWPLHPLDDLAAIAASIADLLSACRVGRIEYAPRVLPSHNAHGQVWFPAVREWPQLGVQ
jgi:hypothetical protein